MGGSEPRHARRLGAATNSTFAISGFTGAGEGTLTVSAGKREMTLAFRHLMAARQDLRCFNASSTYDDARRWGKLDGR